MFVKVFGFPYFVTRVQQKPKIYYFYHYGVNYRNGRYFFGQRAFEIW